MPPRRECEKRAREYLLCLQAYPYSHLQRDRIRWVEAWLEALPREEMLRRRLGEDKYTLLTWVCYEPPPAVWPRGEAARMRAG